jgi:hypothetical protein
MGELFEQRVAMNEVTFRNVNEAIDTGGRPGAAPYFCECGRVGCNQMVELTPRQYEAVRANPRRFFVLPGHEVLEAERIVADRGNHLVVEKTSAAGEIAEDTDPRDAATQ